MRLEDIVSELEQYRIKGHFILTVSTVNKKANIFFDSNSQKLYFMGLETPYSAKDIMQISFIERDNFNDAIDIIFLGGDMLEINKFEDDKAVIAKSIYYGAENIMSAYQNNFNKKSVADLKHIVEHGISSNADKGVLADSCYYYCCGKDPTPIFALSEECPLFIYADTVDYGTGDFNKTTNELYKRLDSKGYQILMSVSVIPGRKHIKEAEITLWKNESGKEFMLLYCRGDATDVFRTIYADKMNYIQPKYICNYRYEISYDNSFLSTVEKRTEYILGHCFNDKYQVVKQLEYFGDYGEETMKMYKRAYWYVY